MSWGSTAPAALAAIGAAVTAAVSDATVRVGPIISDEALPVVVTIGYQDQDSPVFEGEFTGEGMGALPDREKYGINSLITVTNGDGDFQAAQTQAFTVLGEVGAVLAANQRIADTLSASLGPWTLDLQGVEGIGAIAYLHFVISIDAFTTR